MTRLNKTLLAISLSTFMATAMAATHSPDTAASHLSSLPAQAMPNEAAVTTHNMSTAIKLKPIVVDSAKNVVELKLPANATTGYQWYIKHYDHHLLNLLSYYYLAPANDRMGAPGHAVFTFAVEPAFHRAPQVSHIDLVYGQSWNNSSMQPHSVAVLSTGIEAPINQPSHSVVRPNQVNTPAEPKPMIGTVLPPQSNDTPALKATPTPHSGTLQKVSLPSIVGQPNTVDAHDHHNKQAAPAATQSDWLALPTNGSTTKK